MFDQGWSGEGCATPASFFQPLQKNQTVIVGFKRDLLAAPATPVTPTATLC